MSTFSKALQHAERERLLQGRPGGHEDTSPEGPSGALDLPAAAPRAPVATRDRAPERGTGEAVGSLGRVERHLVSLLNPASLLAETYRALRHQIEQIHRAAQGSMVLAVTSAGVGDGKTTTSINLAGALAQAADSRVLLVDADLRNPSIARHLALGRSGPGLVDAILDTSAELKHVVRARPPFNLDILTAGTLPPAPYEILKSPRLGDLLSEARRHYDYVVLDTAPLVPVPDSRLISRWIDGLLLVVAAHKTPRRLVAEALNHVDPEKLVGLVLNEDDGALASYGYPLYGAPLNGNGPTRWRSLLGRLTRFAHV
jgi:non-specific protein-tyrosine kinase